MFKLVYSMEPCGEFPTFEEAFIELYKRLSKDLEEGTSCLLVEQTIWIEEDNEGPMMFYEARDYACNIGLLVNGKLNEEMAKKFQ
jgi:hypothetical protein